MQHLEIELSPGLNPALVEQAIEAALAQVGLVISRRGTLQTFSGSIHWHAQRARQTGTLELTLWPQKQRAWLTIQSGRNAVWIAEILPAVRATLDRLLSELAVPPPAS